MSVTQTVYVHIVVRGQIPTGITAQVANITKEVRSVGTAAQSSSVSVSTLVRTLQSLAAVHPNLQKTVSMMQAIKMSGIDVARAFDSATVSAANYSKLLSDIPSKMKILGIAGTDAFRDMNARLNSLSTALSVPGAGRTLSGTGVMPLPVNLQDIKKQIDATSLLRSAMAQYNVSTGESLGRIQASARQLQPLVKGIFGGGITSLEQYRNRLAEVTEHLHGGVNGVNRFKGALDSARSSNDFFSRSLATLQKALVSMIGITLAWFALITVPQTIFSWSLKIVGAMIKAAADLEERVISLAAVLASTQEWSKTSGENFKTAMSVSNTALEQLLKRSGEINGSISESTTVLQVLVSSGVGAYVKNMQEALDLTILLVNSVGGITVGQDRMRQFSSEVRSLMTGQLRATDMLGRLLFKNADEMKKFMDEAARNKTLLPDITKKLSGFVEAVQPLSMTLTGIKTTAIDIGTQFSAWSFKHLFDQARDVFKEWKGWIGDNTEELKRTAAAFGAIVEAVIKELLVSAGITMNTFKGVLTYIRVNYVQIAGDLAEFTASAVNVLKFVGNIFKIIWNIITAAIRARVFLIQLQQDVTEGVFTRGLPVKKYLTDLWSQVKGIFTDTKTDVGDIYNAVLALNETRDVGVAHAEAEKNATKAQMEIQLAMYDAKVAEKKLQDILLQGERSINEEKDKTLENAKQELQRLKDQEMMLAYGEDKLISMMITRNNIARDLKVEYAGQADKLRQMLILNESLRRLERQKYIDETVASAQKGQRKEFVGFDDKLMKSNLDKMSGAFVLMLNEAIQYYKDLEDAAKSAAQEVATYTGMMTDRTRTLIQDLDEARTSFIKYGGSYDYVKLAAATLREQEEWNIDTLRRLELEYAMGTITLAEYYDQTRALVQANGQIRRSLIDMTNPFAMISELQEKATQSLIDYSRGLVKAGQAFKDVGISFIANVAGGMGSAITAMFQAFQAGEGVLKAFGKMIGGILIQLGEMCVTLGTIAILGSFIPIFSKLFGGSPAQGAALVAAGVAAIALGVALSGSGSRSGASSNTSSGSSGSAAKSPMYVEQSGILAQQGVNNAIINNTRAINGLNKEVSRLSKEKGDVLVTKTIKNNATQVVQSLGNTLNKSLMSTRSLGGAILGEGV